jgi:hypothetical protein
MSAVFKHRYDGVSMLKIPFEDVFSEWERRTDNYTNLVLVRAMALYDRFFLLVQIFGRKDVLHPWLYARCREVESNPDGFLDIWAREHYKSTIITYAGVIQEVLNNPDITIGIFSHTKGIARAFLRQIKQELESNSKLKMLFPDVLYDNPAEESLLWSLDNGIVVKRKSNPKEATIEAHGLVDGMPTSKHFALLVYDDVVTKESVGTPDQIAKTTECWELSDNLGAVGGRKWHIGTRYCTIGSTRILMADWSHKPIKDVQVGDEVIGWELEGSKRWLIPAKVIDRGSHAGQPVNKYTFHNERSVTCTPDHKWWRGARGSGDEYSILAMPGTGRRAKGVKAWRGLGAIRQLLVPVEPNVSWEAGWLAGFFDGEGTIKKNKNHPSGVVCITQTMANPDLIQKCRAILTQLNFSWTESWWEQSKAKGQETWSDRCVFQICGGWRERYRFLMQIAPHRNTALTATLFGQLKTEKINLRSIESAGSQDVFWLETETGNYVAEGFCSKNSYADSYEAMMKRGAVKLRIYPATHDGTLGGKPVLLSQTEWERKIRDQGEATVSTQMLANPLAGHQRMFNVEDLQVYEIRPETLAVYIMCDPARSKKRDSDNTAMVVLGLDYANNKYLLDGFNHKMDLFERWKRMAQLYVKWKQQVGVQVVRVGYESFGAQADLDYFLEQQRVQKLVFDIEELAWPREGEGSKSDRVQRLGPDFRSGKFFLPHPTDENQYTANQRKMLNGYEYRISKPIKRKDENDAIYDITEQFRMQVHFFPFGGKKDLVDAASRIYDMEPMAPTSNEPRYAEPAYT